MSYSPLVEDYFFRPQHVGAMDATLPNTLHTGIGISGQGDYYVLYVLMEEAYIRQASFKAYGNPYLLAGLEWICRHLEKARLDALNPCHYQDLLVLFDMPKRYCPTAIQLEKGYNTVIHLIKDYRENNV